MGRFQNTGQPDWDWWGELWPTPGATLRTLGLSSGETLAEVGCGSGYFALPAARITDPATVYALDLDESLLGKIGHIADQQCVDNLVTVHADAMTLADSLPERVDVVLVGSTFHGVDDRSGFVAEVRAALRPDGRLIVLNWQDRPRETTTVAGEPRGPPSDLRMSATETEAAVLDAGDFVLDRRVELPPYHYGLVFER